MNPGPRPHTGGHPRTLTREGLLDRRAVLLAQPISPARATDLRRIRSALKNLEARSERRGA